MRGSAVTRIFHVGSDMDGPEGEQVLTMSTLLEIADGL
jgi:hypothetical protein